MLRKIFVGLFAIHAGAFMSGVGAALILNLGGKAVYLFRNAGERDFLYKLN